MPIADNSELLFVRRPPGAVQKIFPPVKNYLSSRKIFIPELNLFIPVQKYLTLFNNFNLNRKLLLKSSLGNMRLSLKALSFLQFFVVRKTPN